MLPFTKRPGRGDESGDEDVVTKDDIVKPATIPPASKAAATGRAKFSSINDEEMTTLMPAKSVGDALSAARSSPRPAAGAPPPSRSAPSSKIPPASASRSGKFAAQEDEEEDGRTVVRGAPKIVKRSSAPNSQPGAKMGVPTMPTTISPAAVIKATLESARAGVKPRTDHLMAGPPQDLLEDLADRHPADAGAEHTAILKSPTVPPPGMVQGVKALSTQMLQPQGIPQGTIPPGSSRPLSNPPANANASGGYAAQSGGYAAQYNGPVPSGSVSVPGVAMSQSLPAHFMVPQAPYSDGRIDPPGTAVTARMKAAGRPAMSWAMALAAFGVFVAIGAAVVMQGNGNGVAETGASFVDPSRAAGGKAATAAAAAAAQPAAATPTPVPVAGNEQPADRVGVPPVAVPATPPPVATEAVAAPVVTTPPPPAAPVAAASAGPVPAAAAVAVAPARPAAAPVAAAAPAARPQPAPVARPVRPAPAPVAEETPVAAAPVKPVKGAKPGAKGASGDSAVDEEQRKALKALQESQLETPF